jgi:nicotinate-nucleotide adenylyltransferase
MRRRAAGRDPRHAGPARVGIFGGTFDPPHFAHLALAEWARIELALDQVWFVPAGEPPHKRRGAPSPARHRLAMTRLAVRGNPAFRVTPLECRRAGPSYTVDTVRAFAAAHPRARLHLIMGADMLATFQHWREPAAIAARATLVVAVRPGARVARRRGVVVLSNPGLEVSSQALRARARAGRSIRYLVPDAVARYAARHRLYARRS